MTISNAKSRTATVPVAIATQPVNTPANLTATEYLRALRAGDMTISEYAGACADQIERFDHSLQAFEYFDRELFNQRIEAVEKRWQAGQRGRQMTGVPVGVKDIFNTYDMPTSMGSEIIKGYTPGNDARVVSNIRLEDGIVAGKTVTAEFAVHHPGPTRNPWDPQRTPGTSSSGSVVAVATRMVPVALATQTAGSIIRPASYCGVMGYKPSFGLIPRTAMLKTTDTLDTVGFIGRSVEDLRLMFEVTRVRGHNYPVSEAALNAPVHREKPAGRPWKLGILEGPKSSFEAPAARAALQALAGKLAATGIECVPFRLPSVFDSAHEVHEHIYRRSLAYYFKMEWASAEQKFSQSLREMIQSGLQVSPETYQEGLQQQSHMAREYDAAMQTVDAVLCLATADEAPIGLDQPDLPDHCLLFTLSGAPALTLPLLAGSSGLPVGAQLAARRYDDYKLLALAEQIVLAAG